MQVLLINSDFGLEAENKIMPLTMYSLGAIIRKKGHNIKIIDPGLYRSGFYKENMDDLLITISKEFDVIAFSANTFSWSRVKGHIKQLRHSNYQGKIVVGGIHPSRAIDYVVKDVFIDYILTGEGEMSFPLLLDAIHKGESVDSVPNIVYQKNGKIIITKQANLINFSNSWPLPAYDLVPDKAYKMFSFESSRGCFGNCTFCSILFKKCWRGFDTDVVIERLTKADEILSNKIISKEFDFTDDYFTGNMERAKAILKRLTITKFKEYRFLIESRLKNLYDQDLIAILKEFPNIYIQVGIECGYEEGLTRINKGIRYNEIVEVAEILYNHHLNKNTLFSFIIGFPWETKEMILKTVKTAGFLKSKYNININCVWWLAVPSTEFEILKAVNTKVNEDIFDIVDWHKNNEIFYKTHPMVTKEDCIYINQLISLYGQIGFSIKL